MDICGDGFVMNTTNGFCDDGNIIDGDGCSSTCQVEDGFKCQSGSPTNASHCSYRRTMEFELTRTERVEGQNQGLF